MKEHNIHDNQTPEIIEEYKEEGALTLETLDIASQDAMSNPHTSHKKHNSTGFTLTTPVAIVIGALIIALGLMGYGLITKGENTNTKSVLFAGKPIDETEYVEGKENSKIVVVEYSDSECPYCIAVYSTLKSIRTKYADKVGFVYRHFPLTSIHNHAFDEAKAITCAGTLGGKQKYFEYMDALLGYKAPKQSQKNPSPQLPPNEKENMATNIGLDKKAFTECMNSEQTAKIVNDSINNGIAAGVQGTPSTFVLIKTRKGYEVVSMIDGARGEEYFKAAIDEALAR